MSHSCRYISDALNDRAAPQRNRSRTVCNRLAPRMSAGPPRGRLVGTCARNAVCDRGITALLLLSNAAMSEGILQRPKAEGPGSRDPGPSSCCGGRI